MTAAHTHDSPIAPRWRRFAALAYDLIAVLAIAMVTTMACLLLTRGRLNPAAPWYRLSLLIALAVYFVLSWRRGGQTLGMRPWRIRLTSADGGPVGSVRALLRFAIAATPLTLLALHGLLSTRATLLVPLAGWTVFFAVALVDRRGRALHDLLTATEIRR